MAILYAEALVHIQQLTVTATTADDLSTVEGNVELESDRKTFHFTNHGQTATIVFPSQVALNSIHDLSGMSEWRLPMDPMLVTPVWSSESGRDPWTAGLLASDAVIACKHCKAIISSVNPRHWKDLPSENWAEMMDFWHCHKPNSNEESHSNHATRGYSARESIKCSNGVAFVDQRQIILAQDDCPSLEVRHAYDSHPVGPVSAKVLLAVVDSERIVGLQEGSLSVLHDRSMTACRYKSPRWKGREARGRDRRLVDGEPTIASVHPFGHTHSLQDSESLDRCKIIVWYNADYGNPRLRRMEMRHVPVVGLL